MASNQVHVAEEYIRAQFISRGFYPEFILSQNSLMKVLDALAGVPFNRELALELFAQCQKNYKGDIKIENFIQVTIEALLLIQEKITHYEKTVQEYAVQREECIYNLSKSKDAPSGLKLIVQVIEATHLFSGETRAQLKPYVVIKCDNAQKSTNQAQNDKFNPKWMETFIFDLKTGREKTIATVLAIDSLNQSTLVGETHFSLTELKDQLKHNQWFNLYGRRGEQCAGQLHLELQMLSDATAYYKAALDQVDQYLMNLNSEKQQYKGDMAMIYEVFQNQNLTKPQMKIMIDSPELMFVNEMSKPIIFKNDKTVDLQKYNNPNLTDQEVAYMLSQRQVEDRMIDLNSEYPAQVDLMQKANYGFTDPTKQIWLCVLLTGLLTLFSLLQCFSRTDLLNVTLSLLCLLIITLNYLESLYINFVASSLILSSVLDSIWLAVNRDVQNSLTIELNRNPTSRPSASESQYIVLASNASLDHLHNLCNIDYQGLVFYMNERWSLRLFSGEYSHQ